LKGPIRGYFEERLLSLRRLMKSRGADAAVALVREGYNWETCFHLSGFRGSSCALLIFGDGALLVTDGRYLEQASVQTDLTVVDQGRGSIMEALKRELSARPGIGRLGFQARQVACDFYDGLKKLGKELIDLTFEFSSIRRKKDPEEAHTIEEAARIAAAAFKDALSSFHSGMTERLFAARLEYEMRLKGAEGGWGGQDFIVASGQRSALPHGKPEDKIIERAENVLVDYGARHNGYVSDITRSFSWGKPPQWVLDAHELLWEAQSEAASLLEPGRPTSEIDAAARKVIERAGFGDFFIHGLGHGIGLEVHESPTLSPRSDEVIALGDVVTVEPGIYFPGKGGVRLEDDYYISPERTLCLTSSLERKVFRIDVRS
jgi:Xaa-Pro aminopeptidase